MSMRIYNCKNEAIPVTGKYRAFVLKSDFAAYFPKVFRNEYPTTVEQTITCVNNLLNPQPETTLFRFRREFKLSKI